VAGAGAALWLVSRGQGPEAIGGSLTSQESPTLNEETGAIATEVAADSGLGPLQLWRSASSSDFVRKVGETYATRLLLIVIGMVTTVIVARLLGPEGRGYYAVAATLGALGVQFGNLGLHTSNIYFAAQDPQSLASLTGNSLLVSLGFGGLLAGALEVLFMRSPGLISLHGPILLLALAGIPLGLAYLLTQDLLLGLQDVRGYNLLDTFSKTCPFLLIGVVVALRRVSVAGLFAATIVGLAISCVASYVRLHRRFNGYPVPSLALFQGGIRYATKAYLASFFAFLVLRADLFMVQRMLGPEQTGYYSVASSMVDMISILPAVIGMILFPRLSAMTDMRGKLHRTWQAAWGTAAALLPVVVLAAGLSKWIVRLLFGVAYLPASRAFILLTPGVLVLGVQSVAVQFLNSVGFPKVVIFIWVVCSVFNIGLNLWAIPKYGIAGASVVSSLSYFLAFCLILQAVWRTGRRYASQAE
jgi:O-antigen/teichoic acid export membrane protein